MARHVPGLCHRSRHVGGVIVSRRLLVLGRRRLVPPLSPLAAANPSPERIGQRPTSGRGGKRGDFEPLSDWIVAWLVQSEQPIGKLLSKRACEVLPRLRSGHLMLVLPRRHPAATRRRPAAAGSQEPRSTRRLEGRGGASGQAPPRWSFAPRSQHSLSCPVPHTPGSWRGARAAWEV